MKKVLVFGAFDKLHEGHKYFLDKAKKQGDYLVVLVSHDKNIKKIKGKYPNQKQDERILNIKKLDIADSIISGKKQMDYSIIKKTNPEIICLGYDQTFLIDKIKVEIYIQKLKNIRIIILKSYKPHKFKTSLMKI